MGSDVNKSDCPVDFKRSRYWESRHLACLNDRRACHLLLTRPPLLQIKLVFLPRGTHLLEHLRGQEVHHGPNPSGARGTYSHTPHAGDALCRVDPLGVGEWDGARGTLLGADAATVAAAPAFRLRHTARLLVGAVAWHLRHCGTGFGSGLAPGFYRN